MIVEAWNPPIEWVKETIEKAGTTIGSVHFKKRGNGQLRKMSYRLHVTNPSTAKAPKGTSARMTTKTVSKKVKVCNCGKTSLECRSGPYHVETRKVTVKVPAKPRTNKKVIDKANKQMTVFDANKVVRDKSGTILGRGAWRTVPLENVTRIACKGNTYVINKY